MVVYNNRWEKLGTITIIIIKFFVNEVVDQKSVLLLGVKSRLVTTWESEAVLNASISQVIIDLQVFVSKSAAVFIHVAVTLLMHILDVLPPHIPLLSVVVERLV